MEPPLFDSLPNESTRNTSVFTERIHPNVTRSTLAVKKVAKASNISSLSLASASPAAVVVACVQQRGGAGLMVELLSVVEVVVQPTLPTLLVHYIHTQAQNYMGPKAENTKQEATAKNARGPLYTLIYPATRRPWRQIVDTKSICIWSWCSPKMLFCLVGYFKLTIMCLNYWKNYRPFTM